jgi:endonuclease YncB( thermonuclease family)
VLRAQAVITHVVDGDTVEVETSAAGRSRGIRRRETVRLIGIDTPRRSSPEPRSSAAASRPRTTCSAWPSQDRRDRYGRLLAYVNGSHTGIDVAVTLSLRPDQRRGRDSAQ